MSADPGSAVGPHDIRAAARAGSHTSDHVLALVLDETIEDHLAPALALRVGALPLCPRLARALATIERCVRRLKDATGN